MIVRIAGWLIFATIGPLIAVFAPSTLMQSLLVQATSYAVFVLGIGILLRQNGMVSFGHGAFFGLSGYILGAMLPLKFVPPEVLVIGTIAAVTLIAFAIGLVIVRVHGIAFGMLTLAIGQAVYEAATRLRDLTGGHDGLSLALPRQLFGLPIKTFQQPASMLTLSWLVMVAALVLLTLFARSRMGVLTQAIRDNEERVRFLGYRTLVPRAVVFALSAAVTATGGVLFSLYSGFISPETVHWTTSGSGLIMTILGGTGAVWGPALGAFAYFFFKEAVGTFTTHWLSIIGVSLIFITVAFPAGLAGLVAQLRVQRRMEKVRDAGA